jgi:hypothetical protein
MHLYVTTLCFVSAGGGIAWILAESEKGHPPTQGQESIRESRVRGSTRHPVPTLPLRMTQDVAVTGGMYKYRVHVHRSAAVSGRRPLPAGARCTSHPPVVSSPLPLRCKFVRLFVCLFWLVLEASRASIYCFRPKSRLVRTIGRAFLLPPSVEIACV